MNMNRILRWGIAGAGKMAHDFATALSTSKNHQIVAVASKSNARAEMFARAHEIPMIHNGYGGMAQNKNVDIVYVGVITPNHVDVAKLMLAGDKHVLCERPLTATQKESMELVKYAKFKNLFLMEGMMSRFLPIYKELRNQLQNKVIGDILNINICYGQSSTNIEKLTSKVLGGGSLLNFGICALELIQTVYAGLKPLKIVCASEMNNCDTDECTLVALLYPNGKSASINLSIKTDLSNEAVLSGTKGIIRIPEFWSPTKFITPKDTFEYQLQETSTNFNYKNSIGLLYEADEVRECLLTGKEECELMTHADTLELANLMDILRRDVAVTMHTQENPPTEISKLN